MVRVISKILFLWIISLNTIRAQTKIQGELSFSREKWEEEMMLSQEKLYKINQTFYSYESSQKKRIEELLSTKYFQREILLEDAMKKVHNIEDAKAALSLSSSYTLEHPAKALVLAKFAVEILESFQNQTSFYHAALYQTAYLLSLQKQHQEALSFLKRGRILEQDPFYFPYMILKGDLYYYLKKDKDSLLCWEPLLKINKKDGETFLLYLRLLASYSRLVQSRKHVNLFLEAALFIEKLKKEDEKEQLRFFVKSVSISLNDLYDFPLMEQIAWNQNYGDLRIEILVGFFHEMNLNGEWDRALFWMDKLHQAFMGQKQEVEYWIERLQIIENKGNPLLYHDNLYEAVKSLNERKKLSSLEKATIAQMAPLAASFFLQRALENKIENHAFKAFYMYRILDENLLYPLDQELFLKSFLESAVISKENKDIKKISSRLIRQYPKEEIYAFVTWQIQKAFMEEPLFFEEFEKYVMDYLKAYPLSQTARKRALEYFHDARLKKHSSWENLILYASFLEKYGSVFPQEWEPFLREASYAISKNNSYHFIILLSKLRKNSLLEKSSIDNSLEASLYKIILDYFQEGKYQDGYQVLYTWLLENSFFAGNRVRDLILVLFDVGLWKESLQVLNLAITVTEGKLQSELFYFKGRTLEYLMQWKESLYSYREMRKIKALEEDFWMQGSLRLEKLAYDLKEWNILGEYFIFEKKHRPLKMEITQKCVNSFLHALEIKRAYQCLEEWPRISSQEKKKLSFLKAQIQLQDGAQNKKGRVALEKMLSLKESWGKEAYLLVWQEDFEEISHQELFLLGRVYEPSFSRQKEIVEKALLRYEKSHLAIKEMTKKYLYDILNIYTKNIEQILSFDFKMSLSQKNKYEREYQLKKTAMQNISFVSLLEPQKSFFEEPLPLQKGLEYIFSGRYVNHPFWISKIYLEKAFKEEESDFCFQKEGCSNQKVFEKIESFLKGSPEDLNSFFMTLLQEQPAHLGALLAFTEWLILQKSPFMAEQMALRLKDAHPQSFWGNVALLEVYAWKEEKEKRNRTLGLAKDQEEGHLFWKWFDVQKSFQEGKNSCTQILSLKAFEQVEPFKLLQGACLYASSKEAFAGFWEQEDIPLKSFFLSLYHKNAKSQQSLWLYHWQKACRLSFDGLCQTVGEEPVNITAQKRWNILKP